MCPTLDTQYTANSSLHVSSHLIVVMRRVRTVGRTVLKPVLHVKELRLEGYISCPRSCISLDGVLMCCMEGKHMLPGAVALLICVRVSFWASGPVNRCLPPPYTGPTAASQPGWGLQNLSSTDTRTFLLCFFPFLANSSNFFKV